MRKKLTEPKPVPDGVERLECRALAQGEGKIYSVYKTIEIGLGWEEVEKFVRMFGDAKRRNIRVQASVIYGVPFAEGDTDADDLNLSGTEEHPTSSSMTPGHRMTAPLDSSSAMSSSNRPQASQTATVRKRRTAT